VGYLLRELGIAGATGVEVAQGANGALAAIQLAAGWLALAPESSSALVTTSLNAGSAYLDRWRSAGTKTILGDGGAAAVLGHGSGIARVDSINSMMVPGLEGLYRGSTPLFDEGRMRQTVNVTERGREFAHKNGMEVLDLIKEATRMKAESAHQALSEAGIEPKDLARVVHTHANPAVIDMSVMHPLGLDLDRSSWGFGRTVGHIGAADHLLGLEHFIVSGAVGPGDHVLLIGRANGCNISSAVVTITDEAVR
jgi:3-oxoacyl-[acyl-carrier-protein] synthase III